VQVPVPEKCPARHVPGLSHRGRVCGASSIARTGLCGLLAARLLRKGGRGSGDGRGGGSRRGGCLLMASLDSNREFVDPTMRPR
jgi:hypothetical protein